MNLSALTSCGLVFASTLAAYAPEPPDEIPASEVDPAALASFMEKWKDAGRMNVPMEENDRPFTIAALAKDPAGPWHSYLCAQLAEARFELHDLTGKARERLALQSVRYVQDADAALEAALDGADTNKVEQIKALRAKLDSKLQVFLLDSGEDLDRVRESALKSLLQVSEVNRQECGDVVYRSNALLGRIAVREEKFDEARTYLRAAGRSTGSPTLNSFGPDCLLARELLEHGDPEDREAVLAFLDDIAKFWADPDALRNQTPRNENAIRVAEDNLQELNTWRQDILNGGIPAHRKWR